MSGDSHFGPIQHILLIEPTNTKNELALAKELMVGDSYMDVLSGC